MVTQAINVGWNRFTWTGANVYAKTIVDANQPAILMLVDESLCVGGGIPPDCNLATYVYGDPALSNFRIITGDTVNIYALEAMTLTIPEGGDGGGEICLGGFCLPMLYWGGIAAGVVVVLLFVMKR